MLVGAKPATSITLYLMTQRDKFIDPIFDATVPLVVRYAALVWERGATMSRLQLAWRKLDLTFGFSPSWAMARGPLASTWLSLLRIGWTMVMAYKCRRRKVSRLSPAA